MQLAQRVAHQTELVSRRLELVAIAAGQCRPSFSGSGNALARLRQHSGVKTSKTARLVINRAKTLQREGFAHRLQRRRLTGRGRTGLRAKKQQVLHQLVGNAGVTLGQGCVLHQHARSNALDINIGREQTLAKGFKKASTQLPKSTRLAVSLASNKTQAGVAHIARRSHIASFNDL